MRRVRRVAVLSLCCGVFARLGLSASIQAQSPSVPHDPVIADAAPGRVRIAAVTAETVARYREWLGPPPGALQESDAPRAAAGATDAALVRVPVPWWPAPQSMDVEAAVAFELARQWWPVRSDDAGAAILVNGAAWFLQGRVVERVFEARFGVPAHGVDTARFFGTVIPWSFHRLFIGRDQFLRQAARPGRWAAGAMRVPARVDRETAGAALAFATLERFLTWPVLQGALHAWARQAALGPMSRTDIIETLGAAAGQDLGWLLDAAVDPAARFDYGIEALSSRAVSNGCDTTSCYETEVTVVRRGTAVFSGDSRLPVGPYESGDALELRVRFADGQDVGANWDGRGASRTFRFEGPAPAIGASLDPHRVLLLDADRLDDRILPAATSNVPVTKWVARWLVWIQNAMLTCAL